MLEFDVQTVQDRFSLVVLKLFSGLGSRIWSQPLVILDSML